LTKSELIQNELNHLYKNTLTIDALKSLDDREQLSAPLLLKAYDTYLSSKIKIMYVGKETNHWLTHQKIDIAQRGVNGLINDLEQGLNFNRIISRYDKRMSDKENWKKVEFFKQYKNIKDQLISDEDGSASVVWNNLLKMAYDRGKGYSKTSKNHSKKLSKLSKDLFLGELEILKPDAVIFVTGHTYDSVIKDYFEPITDEEVEIKKRLWKFKYKNIFCYRTVHPHYMKIENKDDYIQKIINHINNDIKV